MRSTTLAFLETVLIRGIEGIIGDSYLRLIIEGHMEPNLFEDYSEAHNMAVQVYFQWRGLGMK